MYFILHYPNSCFLTPSMINDYWMTTLVLAYRMISCPNNDQIVYASSRQAPCSVVCTCVCVCVYVFVRVFMCVCVCGYVYLFECVHFPTSFPVWSCPILDISFSRCSNKNWKIFHTTEENCDSKVIVSTFTFSSGGWSSRITHKRMRQEHH